MASIKDLWLDWVLRPARFLQSSAAGALSDHGAAGDELLEQIADAELLVRHALRQRLAVDAADLALLAGARRDRARLRREEPTLVAFFAAFASVAAAVGRTPADLRALEQRQRRIGLQLEGALRLLGFATAQGGELKVEIASAILGAADAVQAGTVTAADEDGFVAAYRTLAVQVRPVTASTLLASETRFPRPFDLFVQPRKFIADLAGITLGRFAHFAIFTLVLLSAGAVIAYQSVGEAALARYDGVSQRLDEMALDHRKLKATERERRNALLVLIDRKPQRPEEKITAQERLEDAIADLQALERRQSELAEERVQLPWTLQEWLDQPCRLAFGRGACGPSRPSAGEPSPYREIVFDARMLLKRLNVIVLPMLLGLLGAYSFVLRSISREIRARSFEEHSFLHHLVRLSLGALAGIAVGWVLKPEQIGLLSSVPAWVMAFVAGYGIELVFAFLDRIVSSFTSQQAKA